MVRHLTLLSSIITAAIAQDDLGLSNGYQSFQVGSFSGQIVKDAQTLASLNSTSTGYDFLPFDFLPQLAFDGAHHNGDITFRYRTNGTAWTSVDSASARAPVAPLDDLAAGVIAGADLAATFNHTLPMTVTREWLEAETGDGLAVRFNITNTASTEVELGSLGIPVTINNIFTGRPALETEEKCTFGDPYIGLDAGYVRVTPLQGTGNAMVVTPLGSTPFEAWRFLHEPAGNYSYQSQTYEGNYEWQVHSLAWAENEWNSSTQWNTPTSKILKAGETYSVGLRYSLADSIQQIEDVVVKTTTPLAVGVPGYIVPSDMTARLYLNHTSEVQNFDAGDAFKVTAPMATGGAYELTPTGSVWGRTRATITYADGKTHTVHYFISKAAPSTLADMGRFFTTDAHFNDTSDPFNRAPSVMSYDRSVNAIVEQDPRVWCAGLSDEGGTGAYLAAAMKQFAVPNAQEISVLDEFVHETMVGSIQQDDSFGVVASVFFYQPNVTDYQYDDSIDWTSWTSWDRERAFTTVRAYNYIHPSATYWSMYRIARNYPEQKLRADWSWYLGRAYNTTQYCLSNKAANCDYGLVGLMGETVLGELLEDLKREGMTAEVAALEDTMRYRANVWEGQDVPFGSEMAWDSTGQEGVYYWTNYFNLPNTPIKAIDSIFGYMPTVAHWGWNGNARRYWDFIYAAKIRQIERQIHHYGSGLNSLPLLSHYEQNPSDPNALYTLRVAFAGNSAPLTNIDEGGFASAAFHSYPELLEWDPYSGDYGQGFLGLSLGQCVYIVNDHKYGNMVFGGNMNTSASNSSVVVIEPRDAVRRRVFIAEVGLKIEISAGAIEKVAWNSNAKTITMSLVGNAGGNAIQATEAIVWIKKTTGGEAGYKVDGASEDRGGWKVSFDQGKTDIRVVPT